jgi:predicted MPP superfamily phosphohydrolase
MSISRRKFLKSAAVVVTGTVVADAFWFEKAFIEVNEFYLGSASKDTTNIRVVQLSDLHLQSVGYSLKRLAEKLNELKPDLIAITGDAIDKAKNINVLTDFLSLIDHDIQKVAILGNWEYWGRVYMPDLIKVYADQNCLLLVNQTNQFTLQNKTVSITGVDDYIGGNANINAAVKNYRKSDFHVILNHCPQYNDFISESLNPEINVDFILSGHTHGGQINIFGLIPFLPPGSGKYVKGWYNEKFPRVYVSKGIGTSKVPARFGARAEIAIFNLRA